MRRRLFAEALRALCTTMLVMMAACVESGPTGPEGDEAFLAVVTKTDGPAEISAGQSWTLRVKRLDFDQSLDTTVNVLPGDTVIFRLPLDSYDVFLDGVPIACTDRAGLSRRQFLSVPDATFVIRFNVFCNTFLAMNVATFAARNAVVDDEYVYRLLDDHAQEIRLGVVNPVDTVLFDGIGPGSYTLELAHLDPRCLVVSSGGRIRPFVIDPPRVALIRYTVECSDAVTRPRVTHFGSSYRDGQSVFYLEVVDPDPDGPTLPQTPDVDAYYWAITDCRRNEIQTTLPRRGLSQFGATTHGQDTVRLSVVVPVGIPDQEMVGRCTSLRVTDLAGNTSMFVEEKIGGEVGSPPVDAGSVARVEAGNLAFQLRAFDPDGDFAGSFQRFVFRDGTIGSPDGQPDVLSRNIHGYSASQPIPSFNFTNFPFTLEDLIGVRTILIDRQGLSAQLEDGDFSR
jgi:hypothetical protein